MRLRSRSSGWREVGLFAGVGAASLLALLIILQLWRTPSDGAYFPGDHRPDARLMTMLFKTLTESGLGLENERLGAPDGVSFAHLPFGWLQMLLIRMLCFTTNDPFELLNRYFFCTFPLSALTALFALRKLGLTPMSAAAGALLFAFLPYHFQRGQGHIFLSAYFMTPLACWSLLELDRGRLSSGDGRGKRIAAATAVLFVAGFHQVYTTFFVAALLAFLTVRSIWFEDRARRLTACGCLAAGLACGTILNLTPVWRRSLQTNEALLSTFERHPSEAETHGFKIAQLLFPVTGHRLELLADWKERYRSTTPLVYENDSASLGLVGGAGLLASLLLIVAPARRESSRLRSAAVLNLACVLLGTIGGFGSILAWTVLPAVRGYNRISVFIGFFSLATAFLLLDRWRLAGGRWATLHAPLAAGLLVFGLWDQTSARFAPDFQVLETEFRRDREFVQRIEDKLPPGAMIFQLPYAGFPENPPIFGMTDYSHLRGYLHSERLRWSYGAWKDRPEASWRKVVSSENPRRMAEGLAVVGFEGLYVDRLGYLDRAAALEAGLRGTLGEEPLTTEDDRLLFFDLTDFRRRLFSEASAARLAWLRRATLQPAHAEWVSGCSPMAPNGQRWCGEVAILRITNPRPEPLRFEVQLRAAGGCSSEGRLHIRSRLWTEERALTQSATPIVKRFDVPPGVHDIRFACDCDATPAFGLRDKRRLMLLIPRFFATEIGPDPSAGGPPA